MATFKDINNLRKEGRLEDAYSMAKNALEEKPDDEWLKRAMGWVVYAYLDQNASADNYSEYKRWLDYLISLSFPAGESMLFSAVAWSLRKFFDDCRSKEVAEPVLDEIFNAVKQVNFPVHEESYGALLQAVVALEHKWNNYYLFIQWWNLDNLEPADFLSVTLKSGKQMMSLAERTYIAYSKWLLRQDSEQEVVDFLPKIENVVRNYKTLVYPPYYLAKLYLKLGKNNEAVETLKPFAKSKNNEFWVWQLLAEAQTTDDAKLAFYCKALSCGGKEEMLVSLRDDAANVFAHLNFLSEARFEVEQVLRIRNKNNWRIPQNLQMLTSQPWYASAQPTAGNQAFYGKHSVKANTFLYGEIKSMVVLVSFVNESKGFVSFVTQNKQQGYFKAGKLKPKVNSLVEIQCTEIPEKGPTKIFGLKTIDNQIDSSLIRIFTGTLRKNEKGFAVVDKVFVEPKFIKNMEDNIKISGVAVVSFNKKKEKWGWKAISVEAL